MSSINNTHLLPIPQPSFITVRIYQALFKENYTNQLSTSKWVLTSHMRKQKHTDFS